MTSSSEEEDAMRFDLLKAGLGGASGARLGRLVVRGSRTVDTPNFFAITSRGAVPHVTPDMLLENVPVEGTYIALEDFVERTQKDLTRTPPIYKTPATPSRPRPLHNFTATPSAILTLLAARRVPAVPSPQGNTSSSIPIFTSTGFQNLSITEYQTAVSTLKPDMAIPLADLANTAATPNFKRAVRMAERTEDWLAKWFASSAAASMKGTIAILAPTLPIPYALQWDYLTRLSEDFAGSISGLAVYSADVISNLSKHPPLASKPLFSLDTPATPHHVLRQISLGADIFLLPFLNNASDAGIALTFTFPVQTSESPPEPREETGISVLPLGIDLSSPSFSTSVTPLLQTCRCYTCTHHHAAYVHHLLSVREMLGWTLLQIHNHAVVSNFFAGIRQSLAADTFERESARFQLAYEADIPAGTGERPRARGYHFKSEGGDAKRNQKAWGALGDGEDGETVARLGLEDLIDGSKTKEVEKKMLERDLTETPVVPDVGGEQLDKSGFADVDEGETETPVVPDVGGEQLDKSGFADVDEGGTE